MFVGIKWIRMSKSFLFQLEIKNIVQIEDKRLKLLTT